MPADLIGTQVIAEAADGRKVFELQKGPLFSNVLLADEIKRATLKTQSALPINTVEHLRCANKHSASHLDSRTTALQQTPIALQGSG